MTHDAFSKLAEEAIASIPESFRARLSNVAILLADRPTKRQRAEHGLAADEDLFGLYEGTPHPERGEGYEGSLPDRIILFQRPIEESCGTPEEIREEVRRTVWHEIAHHFGMDDAALHEIEERRGWTAPTH